MSQKWKASLPGLFSIGFLIVFLVVKLFVPNQPWEVVDWFKIGMVAVASILGLAWAPPKLPEQNTDKSLLGNLGALFTLAVLGMNFADQMTEFVTPLWTGLAEDVFLIVASWMGFTWAKPQLPSQSGMVLLLLSCGAILLFLPTGGLLLLA